MRKYQEKENKKILNKDQLNSDYGIYIFIYISYRYTYIDIFFGVADSIFELNSDVDYKKLENEDI